MYPNLMDRTCLDKSFKLALNYLYIFMLCHLNFIVIIYIKQVFNDSETLTNKKKGINCDEIYEYFISVVSPVPK